MSETDTKPAPPRMGPTDKEGCMYAALAFLSLPAGFIYGVGHAIGVW